MPRREICSFSVSIFLKEIFLQLSATFALFLLLPLESHLQTLSGSHLHWRQISVVAEAIILTIVSFLPQSHNLLANSLTSLACGIQVESFRKIHGNGIATTMCIGNLRSGTQNIYTFFQTKKREALEKGLLYYGIILCFICGAIIGNQCIKYFHERAILISSVLLLLAFIMMFITRDEE